MAWLCYMQFELSHREVRSLTEVRKRFDRDLFKECDEKARVCTTNYLTSIGYTVSEHPNRYAQDLIACIDGMEHMVECEIKLVWAGKEFPYPTVQLPERKKKFFNPSTQFFIWNRDCTDAVCFWSHDISDLKPVEVPNKYVYSGEYFFQIPMSLVERISV